MGSMAHTNYTCPDCYDTGVVSLFSEDGKVKHEECPCQEKEKIHGVEDAIQQINNQEFGYTS